MKEGMAMAFFMIILFVLLVTVWIRLDFSLGYSRHLRNNGPMLYPYRNGDIQFFSDGQEFYQHYFQSLQNARSSIYVSFYIVKGDEEISQTFLTILGKKAQEGLQVYLLLDRLGSLKASNKILKQIQRQGVHFSYSHTPKFPCFFFTLQARNHRKISVIDCQTGYLGGYNIGKEYIGKNPKLGYWRDYHLSFTGAGIQDLLEQFQRDWNQTGANRFHLPEISAEASGTVRYRFISTYGKALDDQFLSFIHRAKREIIICSPYFIPGSKLQTELLRALERGVKVRIIVPMRSDHLLVKEAAFPYYGPLLKAGAKIHRFYPGFYHAKIILIDEAFCDIGTANFDKRSMYLNDEMNAFIEDRAFAEKVRASILKDIHDSEQLLYEDYLKRPYVQRVKEKAATFVSLFL
ncbi:cardiolipin synthase [Bacillus sp. FJAT-42376]|uniref:cardiolipin synthase n=1 Tax=Bacillus sp. FJAT-42376 TaxID=2014076 RepID=UPI0013DE3FBD|nr:cardiolipin synthase [Bacillus sp. FJAT-42376]